MIVEVIGVLFVAILTGFFVANGVQFLDFMMDYKNYFWKVRYCLAKRAAKKVGLSFYLAKQLKIAIENRTGQGVNIMAQAYEEVAHERWMFKRWICVYCMAGYLGLFINLLGVVILFFWGFPIWLIIAYYFASFSSTYYFLKQE